MEHETISIEHETISIEHETLPNAHIGRFYCFPVHMKGFTALWPICAIINI